MINPRFPHLLSRSSSSGDSVGARRHPRALSILALAVTTGIAALAAGCSDSSTDASTSGAAPPPGCTVAVKPSADDQHTVQTAFIEAADGSTVCLLAGTYHFTDELSISSKNITVKGDGQDKTILDFMGQTVGGNGMNITGDGVTVTEFTMKNTPGDGIRATDVKDIHYKNVSVVWDAQASKQNGAYGFYPVGSDGVRIEGCTVNGARDAGIYVGQSTHILVTDCKAFGNVAGIEIENSSDAEVKNNEAHDNTGGILVFNLPDLPVQGGKHANVHDNMILHNNGVNFAASGTTVARVPAGTGVMILSSDDNEVHDNTISDNQSLGALIFSYSAPLFNEPTDPKFNKYPQGNWVHDNVFSGNGKMPDDAVKLLITQNPVPDIVWDGCEEAGADNSMGALTNCVSMNGAVTYLNMVCLNGMPPDTDINKVTCEHTALPTQDP